MKTFKISGKHYTLDDEDFERVSQRKWWEAKDGRPQTKFGAGKHGKARMGLSRFILNYTGELEVAHLDGNPFNNQKANLCPMSTWENQQFKKSNTSGCSGVSFNWKSKKWEVYVTLNKIRKYLGSFKEKQNAIQCRNNAIAGQTLVIPFDGAFGESWGNTKAGVI